MKSDKLLLMLMLFANFSCNSKAGKKVDSSEETVSLDTAIDDSFLRGPYPNQIGRQNPCWGSAPEIIYSDKKLGKVWSYADNMPEFPGGMDSISAILQKELGNDLNDLTICGDRTALTSRIQFVVDKKGKVQNIKLLKGFDIHIDLKAMAILKGLPFTPAQLDGKPVNVQLVLPIRYEVE